MGSGALNLGRSRLAVSSFYFTMGMVFASWASRIPDIQEKLALTDGQLGTILFAIPCGQLSMMAVSGYLVNRYGSRGALVISTLMYALVLTMIPLAPGFATLFATLYLFGVSANMLNISLNTQAVALEGLYGRNIMSTFHGVWSLGSLFGGLVAVVFVGAGLSLATHYRVVALMALLLVGADARRLITRDQLPDAERQRSSSGLSLRNLDVAVIMLGIICFCGMFCEGTLFDWSSVYFASVVRPDENLVRLGYIFGIGAMTAGRFMADHFVTRFSTTAVLKVCGLSTAAGLLLATAFPYLIPSTVGFLLVGLGISAVVPICYSMAGRLKTMSASIAITVVSSISFLGFLIGPPLIGAVSDLTNLRIALAASASLGLLMAILAPIAARRIKS